MGEHFIEKVETSKPETSTRTKSYIEHEKHLQCHICKELFVKAVTLSCSHTFCQHCINQWKRNQNTCPICRMRIHMQFPTLVIDNLVAKIMEGAAEDVQNHRAALIAGREAAVQIIPPLTNKRRKRARRMSSRAYASKRAR